jgi:hypothetical protein
MAQWPKHSERDWIKMRAAWNGAMSQRTEQQAGAAEDLLTEIRTALNASGVWHLGMDTVDVIKSLIASKQAAATEPKALLEAEDLIERFGTAVTDMFEQMERGDWVDDHGHRVRMNKAMLDLIPVVEDAIKHRAALAATPKEPSDV